MAKLRIIALLAIIFPVLLVTSGKSNAQDTGACDYYMPMMGCYRCGDTPPLNEASFCENYAGGTFYPGEKCCSDICRGVMQPIKTYVPEVQQGCCSKDNTCTSGVIDMGYLQTCEGYQCTAGNYECINSTCESSTLITLRDFKAYAKSKSVILAWSTESETDNAGFNIYRAESEDGNYTKINTH